MKVLIIIAIIIGTVLLVRFTEMLLRFFIGSRQKLKFILKYFPVIELSATLLIVFWSTDYLFSEKTYYQTIILSLVVSFIALISWFIARDLIAGIVFRTQNNLRRGASLQLGKIEGKMFGMRATHIVIETDEGKMVKIPYSRIANEIVSEQPEEGVHEDSKLTLKIDKTKSWKDTETHLRNILLNAPWRILSSEPKIKLLSDEGPYYKIQIFVKTRNKKHTEKLHSLLLSRLGTEQTG